MSAHMFHGDENCVGNVTAGGTESLLLTVKTYRDYARRVKPYITEPEIVMCETGHAALYKGAAHYGVKLVLVPYDPITFLMNIEETKKSITKNTILIVCSAP